MLNTSVISVLRTFSKEEIKRFEEFLLSPYYNKKSAVVNLFNIIKKNEPEYNSPNLDRKRIWSRLYKDKDFNYGVMKNLIYDLGKCADKFIELQNYERDDKLSGVIFMQEQIERNLINAFEKSLRGYKAMLADLKLDSEYFYYNYRALKLEKDYTAIYNKTNKEITAEEEKEIEFLTLFYLTECSEIYNTLFINSYYMHKKYNNANLDLFMNYLEKFDHQYNDITECVLLCLRLILDKTDKSNYLKLKNIYTEKSQKFSIPFNMSLGLTLREHFNRPEGKEKADYLKENYEVSQFSFENNFVPVDKNGYIDPFTFSGLVNTACSLNKTELAEKFIKEYINKVNPEYRDRFYNYSFVTLNLKKKNFSKAMDYLSKMEVNGPMDHVSVKRFQMIIYYESGYTEELYSLIEAFRNFVSKNKRLAESLKLQAAKFIYFIKKFSDLKFKYNSIDKNEIAELKKELLNTEVLNKIWLLEKAEEFV